VEIAGNFHPQFAVELGETVAEKSQHLPKTHVDSPTDSQGTGEGIALENPKSPLVLDMDAKPFEQQKMQSSKKRSGSNSS
jgi:hypothetical protein